VITIGGVPVLHPHNVQDSDDKDFLMSFVEQNVSISKILHDLVDNRKLERFFINGCNVANLFDTVPPLKVNELYWPVGASRFGCLCALMSERAASLVFAMSELWNICGNSEPFLNVSSWSETIENVLPSEGVTSPGASVVVNNALRKLGISRPFGELKPVPVMIWGRAPTEAPAFGVGFVRTAMYPIMYIPLTQFENYVSPDFDGVGLLILVDQRFLYRFMWVDSVIVDDNNYFVWKTSVLNAVRKHLHPFQYEEPANATLHQRFWHEYINTSLEPLDVVESGETSIPTCCSKGNIPSNEVTITLTDKTDDEPNASGAYVLSMSSNKCVWKTVRNVNSQKHGMCRIYLFLSMLDAETRHGSIQLVKVCNDGFSASYTVPVSGSNEFDIQIKTSLCVRDNQGTPELKPPYNVRGVVSTKKKEHSVTARLSANNVLIIKGTNENIASIDISDIAGATFRFKHIVCANGTMQGRSCQNLNYDEGYTNVIALGGVTTCGVSVDNLGNPIDCCNNKKPAPAMLLRLFDNTDDGVDVTGEYIMAPVSENSCQWRVSLNMKHQRYGAVKVSIVVSEDGNIVITKESGTGFYKSYSVPPHGNDMFAVSEMTCYGYKLEEPGNVETYADDRSFFGPSVNMVSRYFDDNNPLGTLKYNLSDFLSAVESALMKRMVFNYDWTISFRNSRSARTMLLKNLVMFLPALVYHNQRIFDELNISDTAKKQYPYKEQPLYQGGIPFCWNRFVIDKNSDVITGLGASVDPRMLMILPENVRVIGHRVDKSKPFNIDLAGKSACGIEHLCSGMGGMAPTKFMDTYLYDVWYLPFGPLGFLPAFYNYGIRYYNFGKQSGGGTPCGCVYYCMNNARIDKLYPFSDILWEGSIIKKDSYQQSSDNDKHVLANVPFGEYMSPLATSENDSKYKMDVLLGKYLSKASKATKQLSYPIYTTFTYNTNISRATAKAYAKNLVRNWMYWAIVPMPLQFWGVVRWTLTGYEDAVRYDANNGYTTVVPFTHQLLHPPIVLGPMPSVRPKPKTMHCNCVDACVNCITYDVCVVYDGKNVSIYVTNCGKHIVSSNDPGSAVEKTYDSVKVKYATCAANYESSSIVASPIQHDGQCGNNTQSSDSSSNSGGDTGSGNTGNNSSS